MLNLIRRLEVIEIIAIRFIFFNAREIVFLCRLRIGICSCLYGVKGILKVKSLRVVFNISSWITREGKTRGVLQTAWALFSAISLKISAAADDFNDDSV